MADLDRVFDELWCDYTALNPQAEAIHRLLRQRGDTVVNDHIALRSFAGPFGLEVLAKPFLDRGYRQAGTYRFVRKRLRAHHYEPPRPGLPKVFISELLLAELSQGARTTIANLVGQIPTDVVGTTKLLSAGRLWQPLTCAAYRALAGESEYAGWMAAFGFRANHFTVSVNALRSLANLGELCQLLVSHGFELNRSGGELIKGDAAVGLQQASTLAAPVTTQFADGELVIPGCYYEFAERHHVAGELFSGFVTDSADKLFESTHRR